MSNEIDLTGDDPIVAYAYYDESTEEKEDGFILCTDCDTKYLVAATKSRAVVRDRDHFGGYLPHIYCGWCDKRVTS